MKSFLFFAVSVSLLFSHSAMAAKCRLVTRNSNLSYYAGEMDAAYEALTKLGYAFDEYDPKNEKVKSIKLHFKLADTRDSTLGCSRTLQIFNSTPDGKASELLYERTTQKFGFKRYKVGDPCDRALEKAVRAVPSCQEMIQKIGKTQNQESSQGQVISSPSSTASSAADVGTK